MKIRSANRDDLENITALYNHYIRTSQVTFDTRPFQVDQRLTWLESFDGNRLICLVAERDETFLGYATSTKFKPKAAYSSSVEVSVYVNDEGQGIGKRLYAALFPRLSQAGVHRAYAGIALPNPASIRLHESFDFQHVAHFSEVGYKFDTYWDVVWLEKDCEVGGGALGSIL